MKRVDKNGAKSLLRLGERLRRAREQSGYSLTQAADRVGMSRLHVWKLECGRSGNPTLYVLLRLAEAYGVRAERLISGLASRDLKLGRVWRKRRALRARR